MKFYTIGYGSLKGTHAERKAAFQKRLRHVIEYTGKSITIVDIRRSGSGSRNGHAFDNSPTGMINLVREVSGKYISIPALANTFRSLPRYRASLNDNSRVELLKKMIIGNQSAVVLLCGCREYKHCHRTTLAEKLLECLGDKWEVDHLCGY